MCVVIWYLVTDAHELPNNDTNSQRISSPRRRRLHVAMPSPCVAHRIAVAGHIACEVPLGAGSFHQGIKAAGDAVHLDDCGESLAKSSVISQGLLFGCLLEPTKMANYFGDTCIAYCVSNL